MRRKIRNKLSAKASRARRQEYLCSLESRVADCHEENQRLRTRIRELEDDNALVHSLTYHESWFSLYVEKLLVAGSFRNSGKIGVASIHATVKACFIESHQVVPDSMFSNYTSGTGTATLSSFIMNLGIIFKAKVLIV